MNKLYNLVLSIPETLGLYNALYDENITDPDEITLMRLENTLFMDFACICEGTEQIQSI